MVFLAVVPLAAGAFANYLVPAMIGAPDMALPRLNALELLAVLAAGVMMVASFFVEGGAANPDGRRIRRSPVMATTGQTFWLIGMLPVGASAALVVHQDDRHDRAAAARQGSR